uniref:Uncharacterized protein n=1 Tax=Oryza meridionalis TaxID=40149 RepID=A0A0E0F4W6_9ORYZ
MAAWLDPAPPLNPPLAPSYHPLELGGGQIRLRPSPPAHGNGQIRCSGAVGSSVAPPPLCPFPLVLGGSRIRCPPPPTHQARNL